jgi:hypothetical protein
VSAKTRPKAKPYRALGARLKALRFRQRPDLKHQAKAAAPRPLAAAPMPVAASGA